MSFERMLRYCAQLEMNNDRAWFHDNHRLYEEAKRDFTELTDLLKYTVAERCGPALAERLMYADARNLLYRIPRDMRIHRHQPPYNPSFRAYIAGDRHAVWPVGYFYRVQPGDRSMFGTGAWCPDADWLRHVRGYISENFDRFFAAFNACGYHFEVLQNDNRHSVDIGLKYVNNDACYPSVIVVGQFMKALLSGKYDLSIFFL